MAGRPRINETLCAPDLLDAAYAWLKSLGSERHVSAHTIRAYESDLRQFLTYLQSHMGGPVALKDVSDATLTDFRGYLSKKAMKGNMATSRARAVSSLRTFYKWLDRNDYLHNPTLKLLSTPKKPHKEFPTPCANSSRSYFVRGPECIWSTAEADNSVSTLAIKAKPSASASTDVSSK